MLSTTLLAIRNANMKLAKTKTQNPPVCKTNNGTMGDGASVSALITTSHLTIHASKLHKIMKFDCATCGRKSDPKAALETFNNQLAL
jgi:S-adenosylmethionine/arginine decarboxylase-like enzyme